MSTIYSFRRGAVHRRHACTHGEPRDALPGLSAPGALNRGPSPKPRRAAPPLPTLETLRENGLPQGEHRPALPGSAGAASLSPGAESRVPAGRGAAPVPPHGAASPAGAGSPHGRTAFALPRRAERPGDLAPPLMWRQFVP